MSGQEGVPSNNANVGHSRGGRGQNAYSRGRGGGVGPAQRGTDGPGGRNGGRSGGRSGQYGDRIMPAQQPRRQPDAHANQYFLNNGGQQAQGQQYGPPGHVGLSLPPGLGAGVQLQFGSIQPNELFGTTQQANATQAHFMSRGQHGVPPQQQQQPPQQQPRQPQQQQQKMQHQQHAAKVSQTGQMPGLVMPPGMHSQGPAGVHAHPQMLMQGHQGQPNQPPFIPAQPQFGPHSMFPVPPGLMMGNQFQPQQQAQPQPQQQQQQQYIRPAVRPPAAKRVLSLVDPTTQKPVDIASSAASANGTASRPRTSNAQEVKPPPVRSLSEASKRQPSAPSSEAKRATVPAIVPAVKALTISKPPEAAPEKKPADAGIAAQKDIVTAMASASIAEKKPTESGTPAQNGPPSADATKAAMKVPEDKFVPAPVPAVHGKTAVPEDKPAGTVVQSAALLPAPVSAAAAAKTDQPQASAPVKELPEHSAAPASSNPLSYAARVKQAAAPKLSLEPPAQVPAKDTIAAVPKEAAPTPQPAPLPTPLERGAEKQEEVVGQSESAAKDVEEKPEQKANVTAEKPAPEPPATPQVAESKAAAPLSDQAAQSKAEAPKAVAAAVPEGVVVGNGETSVETDAGLVKAAEAVKEAAAQEESVQPAEDGDRPASKDAEAMESPEAAGETGAVPLLVPRPKRKGLILKHNQVDTKGGMLDAFISTPPPKPENDQVAAAPVPVSATSDEGPEMLLKTEVKKDEPEDDWEAAAEGMATPSAAVAAEKRAAAHAAVADTDSSVKKTYTRDWLLTYQNQCVEVPAGLDDSDVQRGDGGGAPGGGRPNMGGAFDMRGPRGSGGHGPPAMGPPGIGLGPGGAPGLDSKRWDRGTMRGPDGMGPPPGPPGMGGRGMMGPPGPPMGGRGGRGMAGIDGAKWQRGLQPPPPPPGMQGGGFGGPPRGYGGPAAQLHKTENRYKLGLLVSEDPEEEKRQKEFKSFLNKITPDNYETILEKIIAVGIDSPGTLQGLIDQVFDKALSEPGFSEIYATLCHDLNQSLPTFKDESSEDGGQEITFRRVLLNKCQEEFEEGDAAMKAVEAREKADQERADAKAAGKEDEEEEKEDGEITAEDRLQKKRDDHAAAQLELKARRRALGNIQFIGQLFKKKMLTEKIMHSCLMQLLSEEENPKGEDVECLCKLLSTIGAPLDANPKSKDRMIAYFSRLARLAEHPKLESRHKFMVKDIIDLRAHNWVARRKVEGPKKIEDIHKDARMELQRQRMAPMPDRGDRRRGGPPMDRAPLPQRPPERSRLDDRVDAPIRPMNRAPSQEWLTGSSLRPGGGAPRTAVAEPTVSLRPGGPGAAGAGAGARSASASSLRTPSPARDPSPAPAPARQPEPEAKTEEAKELPREVVEGRAKLLSNEYLSNADVKELVISMQELQQQKADFVAVVESFFNGTFEAKNVDRNRLLDLLITVSTPPESLVTGDVMEHGVKAVLDNLDQTIIDVPFAPTLVGQAIGALAAKGVVSLKSLAQYVLEAESPDAEPREEGEDTGLVDGGGAVKVVAAAIARLRQDLGLQLSVKAWRDTGLNLTSFMPSYEREDANALSKVVSKYDLQFLYPLAGAEQYLPDALRQGAPAEDVIAWIEQKAGDAANMPAFAHYVTMQVLQTSLGDGKGVDLATSALAESSDQVRILRRVSGVEAPKELQQAVITATVDFFTQCGGRKGLLRRLFADLNTAEVASGAALQAWRYNTNDTEAVRDVSTWLDELKESDEQEEE
ncbi:g3975 [Coccomyxa elongata]